MRGRSKECYLVKFLLAIALALGISAAAYAAAATVSVNGGTLQAGEDNDLTCTASANVDGWGAEINDGLTYFVRINYDGDCSGSDMFVNITNDGTIIRELGPIALDNSGSTGNISLSPAIPTTDITDIHILIEGAGGTPDDE